MDDTKTTGTVGEVVAGVGTQAEVEAAQRPQSMDTSPTADKPADDRSWMDSADAQVWTNKFIEHVRVNPGIARDAGTMLGWFANAIEAGRKAGIEGSMQRQSERDAEPEEGTGGAADLST